MREKIQVQEIQKQNKNGWRITQTKVLFFTYCPLGGGNKIENRNPPQELSQQTWQINI